MAKPPIEELIQRLDEIQQALVKASIDLDSAENTRSFSVNCAG